MFALSDVSIDRLRRTLGTTGQRRAYFVWRNGQLQCSNPQLDTWSQHLAEHRRDFAAHEAVFLEFGQRSGSLLGVFLHRTIRGQGAGGVRRWGYDNLGDFLSDGLRLSRGMGRKNALAGLWWGGGKGLIAQDNLQATADGRRDVYLDYGDFISSLGGIYVTAKDVGTGNEDMAQIFSRTRHTTCVAPEVGGSGNPSGATAKGVVCAMEAAVSILYGQSLGGMSVCMQGTGNVGAAMIRDLLERQVETITAFEISSSLQQELSLAFASDPIDIRLVSATDDTCYRMACDIFVPNALGGILGPDTIPKLNTRLVCGAANNQLLDPERDSRSLRARNIDLVPDFLANRMGIVNCANEQYGWLPEDPAIERHFDSAWEGSIPNVTREVFELAKRKGVTTTSAANRLADERAQQPHPIWGHRTATLIDRLMTANWQRG